MAVAAMSWRYHLTRLTMTTTTRTNHKTVNFSCSLLALRGFSLSLMLSLKCKKRC